MLNNLRKQNDLKLIERAVSAGLQKQNETTPSGNEVCIDYGSVPPEWLQFYTHLFRGRTDKVGLGNTSIPVKSEAELLPLVEAHLKGKLRLGFYNLLPDGTCPWAVVEFEDHGKPSDLQNTDELSLQFMEDLQSVGITSCRELSKNLNGKCFHVWIFFDRPISAEKVHTILNGFIKEIMQIKTEVFPKGYDARSSIGNFVRLPLYGGSDELGLGVDSGRTIFVDANGEPYQDQMDFLKSIKRVTETDLDRLCAEYGLSSSAQQQEQEIKLVPGLEKMRECSFVRYCEVNAANLEEPLWYAWITNAGRLVGGNQYIHEYSKRDARYDRLETVKKIRHALADTGPMTHAKIKELGFECDCSEKFKSPLSRATHLDVEAEVERIHSIDSLDERIVETRHLIRHVKTLDVVERSFYEELIRRKLKVKKNAFVEDRESHLDLKLDLRSILAQAVQAEKSYEECGEIVFNWLQSHGAKYYRDREHRHYIFMEKKLMTITSQDKEFESFLFRASGTTTATTNGQVYVKVLQALTEQDGKRIEADTWLHTNLINNTIYFNLNNDEQELVAITASGVTVIENGCNDDQVLLQPSAKILPLKYAALDEVEYKKTLSLLKNLVVDNIAAGESDRLFCYSWVLGAFFVDYVRTKPSLRFEGDSQGGKSTAMELISFPLYGDDVKKIGTTASNYTDGATNPIVLLDNVEAAEMNEGLKNFIITTVTGITKEKRKIGTDRENIYEKAKCLICSTGIENWSIPEVINRTYLVEVDKTKYGTEFYDGIFLEIKRERDKMMSAEFQLVAKLLGKIQDGTWQEYDKKLGILYPDHSKARANSFLALIILIAEELLCAWGNEECVWDYVSKWIAAQDSMTTSTSVDSNPILQYLNTLKKEVMKYDAQNKAQLIPWPFDVEIFHIKAAEDKFTVQGFAKDFHATFSRLSQLRGLQYAYKSARQLSKRIHDSRKQLENAGWTFADDGIERKEGKMYTLRYNA